MTACPSPRTWQAAIAEGYEIVAGSVVSSTELDGVQIESIELETSTFYGDRSIDASVSRVRWKKTA